MQEEIWKDVEGFEGVYQVSNKGFVRSMDRVVKSKNNSYAIKKGINKKQYNLFGYQKVSLYDKKTKKYKHYFVHRLVALNFCNGYSVGLVVNHIDENKLNNDFSNLEWVTQKQNINHGFSLNKRSLSRRSKRKPTPVLMLDKKTNEILREFEDYRDTEKIGCSCNCVLRVCNGKRQSHNGYKWIYKEKKQ